MTHYLKHIRTLAGLAAALLLLASCQLGRHYVRPDVAMPTTLGGMAGADSASLADRSWNEIYTDTVLQGLIRRSLDYNKDMLMAAAA